MHCERFIRLLSAGLKEGVVKLLVWEDHERWIVFGLRHGRFRFTEADEGQLLDHFLVGSAEGVPSCALSDSFFWERMYVDLIFSKVFFQGVSYFEDSSGSTHDNDFVNLIYGKLLPKLLHICNGILDRHKHLLPYLGADLVEFVSCEIALKTHAKAIYEIFTFIYSLIRKVFLDCFGLLFELSKNARLDFT